MLKNRVKKKVVQKLKDEKLKKIRYELRTLLRLEKEKRISNLHEKFVKIARDKSISYDESKKKCRFIIKKQEELRLSYGRYPLCCGICGDRMENLVYNPVMCEWRCFLCYEQAHRKFPKEYP